MRSIFFSAEEKKLFITFYRIITITSPTSFIGIIIIEVVKYLKVADLKTSKGRRKEVSVAKLSLPSPDSVQWTYSASYLYI